MSNQCRCHGVSGSCTIKTCWKTVPNFAKIGDHLKAKYKNAVQVVYNKKKRRIRRKEQKRVKITKDTLVYIDRSPNYCNPNPALGILGTSGRVCNKTSTGSDRCHLLCCGAGYNTQVVREVKRCQCKFVWCCYVTCKECPRIYDRHTCKWWPVFSYLVAIFSIMGRFYCGTSYLLKRKKHKMIWSDSGAESQTCIPVSDLV